MRMFRSDVSLGVIQYYKLDLGQKLLEKKEEA